jgi:glucan 1,3-beta-glucosidase
MRTTGLISALFFAPSVHALSPRLWGVNYSTKKGPDWDPEPKRCKSDDQVNAELTQLKNEVTDRVRLFSMTDCYPASKILPLAPELDLKVWLGIWVGPFQARFNDERQQLLYMLNHTEAYDFSYVSGIQAIYRGDITVTQAIELRNIIRADLDRAGWSTIPVTVADIVDTHIAHPELTWSELGTKITTVNQFPFWERVVNISTAAQYMSDRIGLIKAQHTNTNHQIIITETGWADAGSDARANIADPASMAKWLTDFVCLANDKGWKYYWFDAYDSDWQRRQDNLPNSVEGHFGTMLLVERTRPRVKCSNLSPLLSPQESTMPMVQ